MAEVGRTEGFQGRRGTRRRLGRIYDSTYAALSGRHPNLLPWHFQWLAGRYLYRDVRRSLAEVRGRLLDVGCEAKPYSRWVDTSAVVGLTSSADLRSTYSCHRRGRGRFLINPSTLSCAHRCSSTSMPQVTQFGKSAASLGPMGCSSLAFRSFITSMGCHVISGGLRH